MVAARPVALVVAAALFEIGGVRLVWQRIREHKGWAWIGAGVTAPQGVAGAAGLARLGAPLAQVPACVEAATLPRPWPKTKAECLG